jgi:hypothetical protein
MFQRFIQYSTILTGPGSKDLVNFYQAVLLSLLDRQAILKI